MLQIEKVFLNYMDEASGAVRMPRVGWQFAFDGKGFLQTGYQLQVARDEAFRKISMDSGEVAGGKSTGVEVPMELQTARRYYVRVRAKGEAAGAPTGWSEWSETVSFFTGLVEEPWRGEFISAETEDDAEESKGTYLRQEFRLAEGKEVAAAYVYATALGLYDLYLNGEKVGRDEMKPGWTSYHKHLSYQAYDVAGQLRPGLNAWGAELAPGWYKGRLTYLEARSIYGDRTAFLAELHVRYGDGTEEVFCTDGSWQASDSPTLFAEIYDGEDYDATLEQPGWAEPGFDSRGLGWRKASVLAHDKQHLAPQTASRVRVMETLPAKRMFRTPRGETVLDFGQNLTGWVRFKVRGERGSMALLRCFEVLDEQGNVYLENLRTADQAICYRKGTEGEETFRPRFTYQGFQYAWLEKWPCEAELSDFTAEVVHSDMPRIGHFACSHDLVNRLAHNILWGLKGNFLEVPTDCPQRDERLGWTGDAGIFCGTANFLVNAHAFYSKWLLDLAADQEPTGAVPHVVPDVLAPVAGEELREKTGTSGSSGWADAAAIVPWELYLATGDLEILRRQYDSMKAWANFMAAHTDGQGIFRYKEQYGDWLALDGDGKTNFGGTPIAFTCSAYNIHSLRIVAKTARLLGNGTEAQIYERRLENLLGHFRQNYLSAEGLLTVENQTAYVLALAFDLVPEELRPAMAAHLAEMVREAGGHLMTGFLGTPFLCEALSENGQPEAAWRLLLREEYPGWLYPVTQGATTVWERWNGRKPDGSLFDPAMNSFNHYAYGVIGSWLFRHAAGLSFDEERPGYRRIIFQPRPGGGLDWAEASHETPYGLASIRWERQGDGLKLRMQVPPNATAVLRLPEGIQLEEGDLPRDAAGEIGSGEWNILCKNFD